MLPLWWLGPVPRPADTPHLHRCPRCHQDRACSLECSEHPDDGPSRGGFAVCDTCLEPGTEENPVFVCEVCLETVTWEDGAADDLPRCCDDCWAAFHGAEPRGAE